MKSMKCDTQIRDTKSDKIGPSTESNPLRHPRTYVRKDNEIYTNHYFYGVLGIATQAPQRYERYHPHSEHVEHISPLVHEDVTPQSSFPPHFAHDKQWYHGTSPDTAAISPLRVHDATLFMTLIHLPSRIFCANVHHDVKLNSSAQALTYPLRTQAFYSSHRPARVTAISALLTISNNRTRRLLVRNDV